MHQRTSRFIQDVARALQGENGITNIPAEVGSMRCNANLTLQMPMGVQIISYQKDHPGHNGVTAIAVRDRETKFLAGHVVDQKGAGEDRAVKQLLKDLRKCVITTRL